MGQVGLDELLVEIGNLDTRLVCFAELDAK